MCFDNKDFSKRSVTNMLETANRKKDEELEMPLEKNESDYLQIALRKLSNEQIATLSEILLEVKKDNNSIKKKQTQVM
jgi:hypothetical protein